MLEPHQLPYVLAGTVLMTLQPLLVTLSQNKDGRLDYNPVVSTLSTEALKIIISACSLLANGTLGKEKLEIGELLRFSVPAVIYFVNNNLLFFILMHVNPTTFQLLSQLKTVFTGLLFRLFLGRTLTKWQYLSILQLTCGTATSQIPLNASSTKSSDFLGYMLSVVSCILSACGGIYSEKLLKDNPNKSSIHWQNLQLYGWGVLFNAAGACLWDPDVLTAAAPFKDFNFWACLVVINNSLNGLAISAILKYADNIARVYAHAMAMLLTMLLSIWFFGQTMTPQLLIAIVMVGASAVQYNLKEDAQVLQPEKTPVRPLADTKLTKVAEAEQVIVESPREERRQDD